MIKKISTQRAFREWIFLKPNFRLLAFLFVLATSLPLTVCAQHKTVFSSANPGKRINLYPVQTKVKYARGFSISYHGTYKLVNLINYNEGRKDTLRYLLVDRKHPVPQGYSNAQVIRTPVRTLIGMSSMHIAMCEFAGISDAIVGQGSLKYVSSQKMRQNIRQGKVKEVGLDGSMNNELIISMRPDLLMVMGNPTARFSRYQTLIGAGIPVLTNNEWLESTPLGRLEWVKLIAALANKEALTNQKFSKIEQEYLRLTQLTKKVKFRPVIISGIPFKGTWLVPDADSYTTKFFKDAGANYKWAQQKGTGSLSLSFEAIAPTALKADYWLNVGYVNSKADILAKDVRFADFKPFKTGQIFNYNNRVNDLGANDFWESGGINPHLILADLIKILHPGLLPAHKLVYYKKLR